MRALYDAQRDDFEQWHERAAELGRASGSANADVLILGQRFFALIASGDAAEARVLLDGAIASRRFAELGAQLATTTAWSRALTGDVAGARQVVDSIAAALPELPVDSEWLATLTQLADTIELIGGHELLPWVREQLAPYADRWVVEGIGMAIRGPVSRWLGPVRATVSNRFERTGDVWTITFDGVAATLRDSKGLRDLAQLVAQPGRELAALDLVDAGATLAEGDTGNVLDATARRAYQQRIVELEAELDAADRDCDAGRSAALAAERDAIVDQLAGAYGLGGRGRRSGGSAERARTAVTARIRDAIRRIGKAHGDLGHHLARSVRTGTFCCYDPDPPLRWNQPERASHTVRSDHTPLG
jgi:hypothetical protein